MAPYSLIRGPELNLGGRMEKVELSEVLNLASVDSQANHGENSVSP